nr:hypothetical protein [Pseudomonas sp.]
MTIPVQSGNAYGTGIALVKFKATFFDGYVQPLLFHPKEMI